MPEIKPHACGAKTRSGGTCKSAGMTNGRCRMHGGTVGEGHGAPEKNKNAVSTHEFEAIWLDQLEPVERVLVQKVTIDKLDQLNEQIRLTGIRIRRMLERIAALKAMPDDEHDDGLSLVELNVEVGEEATFTKRKRKGRLGQIQAIEDALTRVQGHMAKLLDSKHRMEMDGSGTNGDDEDFNGSLFEEDGDDEGGGEGTAGD